MQYHRPHYFIALLHTVDTRLSREKNNQCQRLMRTLPPYFRGILWYVLDLSILQKINDPTMKTTFRSTVFRRKFRTL